jgi:hypothetical protein
MAENTKTENTNDNVRFAHSSSYSQAVFLYFSKFFQTHFVNTSKELSRGLWGFSAFNAEPAVFGYAGTERLVSCSAWPCAYPFLIWQRTSYVHRDHPCSHTESQLPSSRLSITEASVQLRCGVVPHGMNSYRLPAHSFCFLLTCVPQRRRFRRTFPDAFSIFAFPFTPPGAQTA